MRRALVRATAAWEAREATRSTYSLAKGTTSRVSSSLALSSCRTPMMSFSWFCMGMTSMDLERYPVAWSYFRGPVKSKPSAT